MGEQQNGRLVSLDVFRGITIMGMILVNNPGSWGAIYPALEHAKWHGVTPTDLIFPFFLFMVGITTTLSLTKRKERGDNLKELYLQILRRAAILFGLGLVLASFPFFPFEKYLYGIRIPGVLQRIGLVYLITSVIFLKTSMKTQAIIGATILFIYWGLLALVPVPGVGYPNFDAATGLGAWFDRLLLNGHLWKGAIDPTGKFPPGSWDPEGLLSTLPAISTAICGVLTGHWLRTKKEDSEKVLWMFVVGNISLVISMFWDMAFPLNKGLWTSSYVIYCAGMALIFFSMCYFLVDMKKINWWTKPFLIYGTNAITVFFLSGIVGRILNLVSWIGADGKMITLKGFLYKSLFTWWLSPINASLAWAVMYILIWLALMSILYRKKIFIKI